MNWSFDFSPIVHLTAVYVHVMFWIFQIWLTGEVTLTIKEFKDYL